MANDKDANRKGVQETNVLTIEQVVGQLGTIAANLPQHDVQVPVNRRSQLARVDARFVAAVANGIANVAEVEQILGSTGDELRVNADESLRWTAAIDAARALVTQLEAANFQRRQRTGLKALQAYKICQQLVRDGGHADRLGTHVAEMKRVSNFNRKRKSTTAAPPPDQPHTQSM